MLELAGKIIIPVKMADSISNIKSCICKDEVFTSEIIEYNTYTGNTGTLIISD